MIDNLRCPVCKRDFYVAYPDLWAYKRSHRYFCSWGCLRRFEKGGKEALNGMKVTQEQKEQAIELALSGGDPILYLREKGSTNPGVMWSKIRMKLEEDDPEKYNQLPDHWRLDRRGRPRKAVVEVKDVPTEVEPENEDIGPINGPLKAEQPAPINKPLMHSGLKSTGWAGEEVEVHYIERYDVIVISNSLGDSLKLTAEHVRKALKDIATALDLLGVE